MATLPSHDQSTRCFLTQAGWLALIGLLAAGLPLFLCMPLWVDVTLYDILARNVLRGGVPYRDMFDNNLPGMLWIHLLLRPLLGWSSVALRAVDVLVVGSTIWLLVRFTGHFRVWAALLLVAFYLSTTEWCHCQRDVWALLPAMRALQLRFFQVVNSANWSGRKVFFLSLLEGLLWGAAVWIKPFIMIPAITSWLMSVCLTRREAVDVGKQVTIGALGLLAGGLLAGGAGIAWLVQSGGWPYFVEVFRDWNPRYFVMADPWPSRLVDFVLRFFPWNLVHLLAIPVALTILSDEWKSSARVSPRAALLAAMYLGWFVQAHFFQQNFDYLLTPPVMLALAVLASRPWWRDRPALTGALVTLFLGAALVWHPVLNGNRLVLWKRCLAEGSTAELRDLLTLSTRVETPCWTRLEKLATELSTLDLHDGELTCPTESTVPLYLALDLKPSTRFVMLQSIIGFFPTHWPDIRQELRASRQRYVVGDVRRAGLRGAQETAMQPGDPLALPPDFPAEWKNVYPWSKSAVFRQGGYFVYPSHGSEVHSFEHWIPDSSQHDGGPVRRLLDERARADQSDPICRPPVVLPGHARHSRRRNGQPAAWGVRPRAGRALPRRTNCDRPPTGVSNAPRPGQLRPSCPQAPSSPRARGASLCLRPASPTDRTRHPFLKTSNASRRRPARWT